jgi:hypothetical protein
VCVCVFVIAHNIGFRNFAIAACMITFTELPQDQIQTDSTPGLGNVVLHCIVIYYNNLI